MRLLANLLFKVTLSSMVLTAPAMISRSHDTSYTGNALRQKETAISFYSSAVIRKYIDRPSMVVRTITVATTVMIPAPAPLPAPRVSGMAAAKAAELRVVINQASYIYASMNLNAQGLDPKAFEYAWRGYHNLVKRGVIHKRSVLSICDFSQSSRAKRMYVIDVLHRKLLYRTYVAHGQNSGDEYATSFSNDPDSYKSSLGFYVTMRTYLGHNGLSLKLNGVDSGYNDMAMKRQIVLHGSSYVSDKYMQDYGTLGTSLGCPALPSTVSGQIIRTVKGGSCLFIYHPTPQYLENSPVING